VTNDKYSSFRPRPPAPRTHVALIAGVALASIVVGAVFYVHSPARPVPVVVWPKLTSIRPSPAEKAAAALDAVPALPTVRMKNPFDASEVFEFPPGTTKEEARAAIADILMKRAQDREHLFVSNPPHRKSPSIGPAARASR
jgi:hypothetical protein